MNPSDPAGPSSLTGRLTLQTPLGAVLSESRIRLLEAIDRCGSLNRAAREVPLSYKAAWEALDTMNRLAPEPLVERLTGGRGGGGTRLTGYARQLVRLHRAMESSQQDILDRIGLGRYFDAVSDGNNITKSKPDPEVFLKAAEMLGLAPADCLVVEDAVSPSGAAGVPELTELPSAGGCPAGAGIPTTICSPSPTWRARFRPMVSAPSSAPPAAETASAIRAPGARVTRPGAWTNPTTLTTTGCPGSPAGAAPGRGAAEETISTGGSFAETTGAGSSRIRVKTVTSTATPAVAARAIPPARPGSARIMAPGTRSSRRSSTPSLVARGARKPTPLAATRAGSTAKRSTSTCATALARRSDGNQYVMYRMTPGAKPASATPSRKRST